MTSTSQQTGRPFMFWPHLACAGFLVLWLDAGTASELVTRLPSAVKLGILGVWLIVAVARSFAFLSVLTLKAWPLLVMILVSVLYAPEIAQSNQYTQGLGYLFIAFSVTAFYFQPQVRRERLILMWVMLTDFTITGIRTLVALQADPQLARYLATTKANRVAVYGSYNFAGLGGYPFAYSLGAILIILLYFLARCRGKIVLAVVIAFGVFVLIEFSFVTAIIIVFALGGAFLIFDIVRRIDFRIFSIAAVILGWVSGLYSITLEALARISWINPDVGQRFVELSQFLSGDLGSRSDLGIRMDHWSNSIEILVSTGPFGLAGQSTLHHSSTGGHSQWLDMLASYGLWMGMLALFFVFAWRQIACQMPPIGRAALRRCWLFFFVVGTFDTLLFSTIVLTWLFLLPSLTDRLANTIEAKQRSAAKELPV